MTRFARGGTANKKKPHTATPWDQLQKGNITQKQEKDKRIPQKMSHEGKIGKDKVKHKKMKIKLAKREVISESTAVKSSTAEESNGHISAKTNDRNIGSGIISALEQIDKDQCLEKDRKLKSEIKKKSKKNKGKEKAASKVDSKKQELLKTELIENLDKIKDTLVLDDSDKTELSELIKKDQRREKRRLKRIDKKADSKLCFNCRESGHNVADCPRIQKGHSVQEQGTGICFKCGSTEHTLSKCRLKLPQGQFPYATCFICGEQGHLSKQCPDNPRGMYPKGGCCMICSSVEHYKKDCPELQKEQGVVGNKLGTLNTMQSVDDEVSLWQLSQKRTLPKKAKIVKF